MSDKTLSRHPVDPPAHQDLLSRIATLEARVRELEAERDQQRDQTEARIREQTAALRESEERFRRALAIETVGVIFFDPAGDITRANDAFLRMGGYTQEDVAERRLRWDRLTPPEWMPASRRAIAQLKTTGSTTPYEKEYYRKDGSRWWGLFAAKGLSETEGVEFILDITESKRSVQALRESEVKYRTLFDAMDEGFCIVEVLFDEDDRPVDYRFLEVNPAFVQQTGLEDPVGKRMRQLAPAHEEHWFETYGRVATTGEAVRFEQRAEALHRWYDVFAFRVDAPEERRVAILFKDITGHKRAEAERERLLRDAESARAEAETANRAKVDFLGAMSHELRTPLNAVGGYVDLLDLGVHGPVTEAQRAALSRITANQRHLLMLINDILAYAKLEAGQVPFDLRRLAACDVLDSVEPLVAPQATAKGIAYSAQPCDPALGLIGDQERVRQILLNLVTNGIKFTAAGGWVLLSCEADTAWLYMRVRDNGPGIALEKQAAIFDPFIQVDRRADQPQEGVGLGLAISRDLARGMGGDLTVESAPGAGSTFSLRLPRAADEPRASG